MRGRRQMLCSRHRYFNPLRLSRCQANDKAAAFNARSPDLSLCPLATHVTDFKVVATVAKNAPPPRPLPPSRAALIGVRNPTTRGMARPSPSKWQDNAANAPRRSEFQGATVAGGMRGAKTKARFWVGRERELATTSRRPQTSALAGRPT
jgi:hypothetical protein